MGSPATNERTWRVVWMHWPLVRVVLAALSTFTLLIGLHFGDLHDLGAPLAVLVLFVGIFYTQLFEYAYHRLLMHGRCLAFIVRGHREHHRIFHGENFASRRIEDLQHVAGPWFLFPLILLVHYGLARLALPPELALAFVAGCVLHYLAFELSHWFAHVDGNLFDRSLARVPVVGALRRAQLTHHRVHHDFPDRNFNFSPPYAGDRLRSCSVRSASRAAGPSD